MTDGPGLRPTLWFLAVTANSSNLCRLLARTSLVHFFETSLCHVGLAWHWVYMALQSSLATALSFPFQCCPCLEGCSQVESPLAKCAIAACQCSKGSKWSSEEALAERSAVKQACKRYILTLAADGGPWTCEHTSRVGCPFGQMLKLLPWLGFSCLCGIDCMCDLYWLQCSAVARLVAAVSKSQQLSIERIPNQELKHTAQGSLRCTRTSQDMSGNCAHHMANGLGLVFIGHIPPVQSIAPIATATCCACGSLPLELRHRVMMQVNLNAKGDDHVSFSATALEVSPCQQYLLVCTDGPRLLMLSIQGETESSDTTRAPTDFTWRLDATNSYPSKMKAPEYAPGPSQTQGWHQRAGMPLTQMMRAAVILRSLYKDVQDVCFA